MDRDDNPNSALDLARRLEDFVSQNALAGRELKSLAHSIDYSMPFYRPARKLDLLNELVLVNAFMGAEVLRQCAAQHDAVPQGDTERMVEEYVTKLLSRWLPSSMHSGYRKRLAGWGSLPLDDADSDAYVEALHEVVSSFYESLTGEPPDEMSEAKLSLRFNGYMKRYIPSVITLLEHYYGEEDRE